MDSRILGHDPMTGVPALFHSAAKADPFPIENRQELILDDLNVAEYNDVSTKSTTQWKGNMHRVASIPMVIYADMVKTGMIHDQKALKKWLSDPDNRVFRTKPGSL